MIDISNYDKAEVLAALYNAARPQGMGFMHYDPTPMTTNEARRLLQENSDFDYLKGRVIKVDLRGSVINPHWYDRDNGEGAADVVIKSLSTGDVNNDVIKNIHGGGRADAAQVAEGLMDDESHFDGNTYHLGLASAKGYIAPKIKPYLDGSRSR